MNATVSIVRDGKQWAWQTRGNTVRISRERFACPLRAEHAAIAIAKCKGMDYRRSQYVIGYSLFVLGLPDTRCVTESQRLGWWQAMHDSVKDAPLYGCDLPEYVSPNWHDAQFQFGVEDERGADVDYYEVTL